MYSCPVKHDFISISVFSISADCHVQDGSRYFVCDFWCVAGNNDNGKNITAEMKNCVNLRRTIFCKCNNRQTYKLQREKQCAVRNGAGGWVCMVLTGL